MSSTPTIVSATLKVESGPRNGKAITLRPGEVRRVGRSVSADLSIPHDPSISSVHFAIECAPVMACVRDLGSSNGITVNGKKTKEARLVDGDRIVAGDTTFVIRVELRGGPAVDQSTLGPPVGLQARRPYQAAIGDDDPLVRREALLAAAWTRQPWLLDHLRKSSSSRTPERLAELWLLALLGGATDLNQVLLAAETVELGPQRLRIVGTFGHPAGVDLLLREIKSEDPLTAVAAGAAFSRITGADISPYRRVLAPSAGTSEGESASGDFEDEVWLPDPARAAAHWESIKKGYARGSRWVRGYDLSAGGDDGILPRLDLESRWEVCLRDRFEGRGSASMVDVVRLPRR